MQSEIGSVQQELICHGLESCNNLPLLTASLGEGVIAGEVSALDTPHCGRSSLTEQLPLFSGGVFQNAELSKQIFENFQTNSSPLSLFRRFISSARLAPISQMQAKDPGLQELVAACFLRDSDHCDYSKFRTLFLRTCKASSAVAPTQPQNMQLELFSDINLEDGGSQRKHVLSRTKLRNSIKARISSEYSGSLANWGIAAHGNSAMETDGSPKTDAGSSLWVITGNIQCRLIEPNRPTLLECLDSATDEGFTLKTNSCRAGYGNQLHPTPAFQDQHLEGDRIYQNSAPSKTSATHKVAVMYRSATGSRLYTEESPTLRSLANTGGKHQGGSGAWKVVEYKGEEYVVADGLPDECSTLAATEAYIKSGSRPRRVKDGLPSLIPMAYRRQRPLSATEFERLMGWPTGSTEKGITASGKEITISKTQRQKMLGNGIIPQEIQDICLSLKPFLESSYHQPEALEPGEELSTSSDFQQT